MERTIQIPDWLSNASSDCEPIDYSIESVLDVHREIEKAWTYPDASPWISVSPRGFVTSVRWMIAPHVPLETEQADGTRKPVLCWQVSGVTLVHPERVEKWLESLAELGRAGVVVSAEQIDRFPEGPIPPVPFGGFR